MSSPTSRGGIRLQSGDRVQESIQPSRVNPCVTRLCRSTSAVDPRSTDAIDHWPTVSRPSPKTPTSINTPLGICRSTTYSGQGLAVGAGVGHGSKDAGSPVHPEVARSITPTATTRTIRASKTERIIGGRASWASCLEQVGGPVEFFKEAVRQARRGWGGADGDGALIDSTVTIR